MSLRRDDSTIDWLLPLILERLEKSNGVFFKKFMESHLGIDGREKARFYMQEMQALGLIYVQSSSDMRIELTPEGRRIASGIGWLAYLQEKAEKKIKEEEERMERIDLGRRSTIAAESSAKSSETSASAAGNSARSAQTSAFWTKVAAIAAIVAIVISLCALLKPEN